MLFCVSFPSQLFVKYRLRTLFLILFLLLGFLIGDAIEFGIDIRVKLLFGFLFGSPRQIELCELVLAGEDFIRRGDLDDLDSSLQHYSLISLNTS